MSNWVVKGGWIDHRWTPYWRSTPNFQADIVHLIKKGKRGQGGRAGWGGVHSLHQLQGLQPEIQLFDYPASPTHQITSSNFGPDKKVGFGSGPYFLDPVPDSYLSKPKIRNWTHLFLFFVCPVFTLARVLRRQIRFCLRMHSFHSKRSNCFAF